MPTSSERAESRDLPAFLAAHTPFQAATEAELTELSEGATIEEFPAGAVVADYAVRVPDEIWLVRDGAIALRASRDGALIDVVEPGGLFGYLPLLAGAGMDFQARTTVPTTLIKLPGSLVRAQFAKPAGLAFLASSGWNHAAGERPAIAPATDSRPVAELVHGDVLLVEPVESVRDVVVRMTERHVSYALIRLRDGHLGIFTDRDLRTRVVAAGLPVDVPIARVMRAPARTVTADLTADSVLMEMLECGLRHMPVLNSRGEVLGVVEDADLLAASARESFMLRRSIALAGDAAELQQVGQRVTGTAVDLFRNGTKTAATSAILSVVIDSLVRRALEIVLSASDSAPADGFAWLTLGSVARREAMPSSDVDSALSWRDDMAGHAVTLRRVAADVHQLLDRCGLPSDSNGAVAAKPKFSRSQSDWLRAAQGWLADPLRDRGLVFSSLLIDGRVVWGDARLHSVPAAYQRIREEHPNALRLQLLDALSGKVRMRSLRDVLSRRGGTFDLKNHAVTPIVNLARWGGLSAGLTSASTPARLEAAAQAGALSQRDADTLRDVFTMLQRLRMAHQVEQIAAGHTPGDIVTMAELSPLNRSLLGDGLREIAAVRRRVGNFGYSAV
ncbi:putative signal-transduction protein containing cAMP-binding and CBS domains [Mycolicibacterium chubuense NBB4]|uniref:Putative signal-transduction protein containing cAMP-binding and CBS domains n=1 Tax=Mycolicibacterium chubuense (strain NBB4) TaxID=710421 RepID=I4BKM5_MYCCN|nr:putative nucleotidyltransferase substrate binding domain-containing protein [Mycolicibacterium chubuense]AFM17832.1 putative signal-transduction protein containing cAMP-binding and CBS domains [Mycolicibacterium chubuense NBB4]